MRGSGSIRLAGAALAILLWPLAARGADDRRTVTAVRAPAPIVLDGSLDEEVWRTIEPAADFVQAEPHEGAAATEPTEVRVAFDAEAIYFGVRCRDSSSAGGRGPIINDIRKDFTPGD